MRFELLGGPLTKWLPIRFYRSNGGWYCALRWRGHWRGWHVKADD